MTPRLQQALEAYAEGKRYVGLALAEREKWRADPGAYRADDAPELVRELCRISQTNVALGVAPQLCHRVEQLTQDLAYRVCLAAEVADDVPMIPTANRLLEEARHG